MHVTFHNQCFSRTLYCHLFLSISLTFLYSNINFECNVCFELNFRTLKRCNIIRILHISPSLLTEISTTVISYTSAHEYIHFFHTSAIEDKNDERRAIAHWWRVLTAALRSVAFSCPTRRAGTWSWSRGWSRGGRRVCGARAARQERVSHAARVLHCVHDVRHRVLHVVRVGRLLLEAHVEHCAAVAIEANRPLRAIENIRAFLCSF